MLKSLKQNCIKGKMCRRSVAGVKLKSFFVGFFFFSPQIIVCNNSKWRAAPGAQSVFFVYVPFGVFIY